MSDYDRCEKHGINYLVPEVMDCPRCALVRIGIALKEQKYWSTHWHTQQEDGELLLELDRLLNARGVNNSLTELLERLRNYDHVIQAVATALGGVCCGGVDTGGPGSTKAVLVEAIEALKQRAEENNRGT